MMYQRRCNICRTAWSHYQRKKIHNRVVRPQLSLLQHSRTHSAATLVSSSHHVDVHLTTSSLQIDISRLQHVNNTPLQQYRYLSSSSPNNESTTNNNNNSIGSSTKPAVSEAQRRAADLELNRMNVSTSRLLSMNFNSANSSDNNIISEAIINEVRVALHYWSRRWYMHYHPGFGRAAKGSALSLDAVRSKWDHEKNNYTHTHTIANQQNDDGNNNNNIIDGGGNKDRLSTSEQLTAGNHGAIQAERLLNWSISNNLISHGIFHNSHDDMSGRYDNAPDEKDMNLSPNIPLVNIIETYLLPIAYGGAGLGGSMGGTSDVDDNNPPTEPIWSTASARSNNKNNNHNYARSSKYNTITTSHISAVVDATRILKQMKLLHTQFPNDIYPDTLSIKAELNVWSKRAALLLGPAKPRAALKRMEKSGGGELYNDDEAYTFQGCLNQMENILKEAEERYITTQDECIKPSYDWYNHILGTWAKSYDLDLAMRKSQEILFGMEAYADNPDQTTSDNNSNRFRQCWAKPNTISYNSVLYCLTRDSPDTSQSSRDYGIGRGRAKEAEALLQRMKDLYYRTKNVDIQPDEVTYGSVLHALAQAGMGNEAERLLDSLEDDERHDAIVPSLTIYNSVLNAWANSTQRNAPHRAEELLERMKILSSTGKNPAVEPDSISISTVMICHSRSKTKLGAERGEQMLNEAIAMYSQSGNTRVKPDSIMFNCAIQGWTNISGNESEQDGAVASDNIVIPAERAERLLEKMRDPKNDVQPGIQTFNIIIDCVSDHIYRWTCVVFCLWSM